MNTTQTITIFRTEEDASGQKNRQTLRKIKPSKEFEGYGKSGKLIHAYIMDYIKDLEPTSTGYYLS